MIKGLVISLVMLFAQGFLQADDRGNCIPVHSTSVKDLAYRAGERANYTLTYKWGILNTDVAKADVNLDSLVIGGTPSYHCRVFGETAGIFRSFFKVSEDFQSWFTCEGVKPLRFYRYSQENKYVSKNEYTYYWDNDMPYADAYLYNTVTDEDIHMTIPLSACSYDLPALYYFARNIDMSRISEDVHYPISVAIDDAVYNIYYIYKGKEEIKLPELGMVKCLKFQAKLIDGEVFDGDSDMDIYVSDDGNRVPVYFRSPLRVGEARGRITAYSGLKYPFDSLQNKKND